METIRTVLGPCLPEALGFCHSHDHLTVAPGLPGAVNPDLRVDDPGRTLMELDAFHAAGGGAIADAQPVGCGREPLVQMELSRRSGVHIIAATGFHEGQFYLPSHWLFTLGTGALEELFVRELTQGMFLCCDVLPPALQCPARAGFIKSALTAAFDAREEGLFRAAAGAQRRTGAPLMVHCGPGSDPLALSALLLRWGVPPERVAFCHMDRTEDDIARHKELCRRGHYLEYDTIGRSKYHSDRREAALILELLDAGFGHCLLMGLDSTRARLKSYGGTPGLCHILNSFLPLLRSTGVGESALDGFFRAGPARYFTITR